MQKCVCHDDAIPTGGTHIIPLCKGEDMTDGPDQVEILFSNLYNKLPKPVRDFKDESAYIISYGEKENLGNIWICSQLAKSFVHTGKTIQIVRRLSRLWKLGSCNFLAMASDSKGISFTLLCVYLIRYYLDIICIKYQPTAFLCGFVGGFLVDRRSLRGQKLLELKSMGATIQGSFSFKKNVAPLCIETGITYLSIYLIPKLLGLLENDNNKETADSWFTVFGLMRGKCSRRV